jgi:hypothetical protein
MMSYFAGIVDLVGGHPHYALMAIFLLALSEVIPVIFWLGRRYHREILLRWAHANVSAASVFRSCCRPKNWRP